MDKGFNGTTVAWGSTSLKNELLSVNFSSKAAKVKLPPESDGGSYVYVPGIPDLELTVKVAGGATLVRAKDDLTLTWNDGTVIGSFDDAQLFDIDVEGSQDNPISTTFKFAPGPA